MKNRLFVAMAALFAGAFTFLASSTASSACFWGAYQPEEPKSLREE